MGKDLGAIWGRKGIRALLMMIPVVLIVLIPVIYFVAISLLPAAENSTVPQAVLQLLPETDAGLGYRQAWMDAFTTLICPLLFLCVPIICGAASSACAFVAEKENGTLETLLLSSMDPKSIFNAKITGCVLLSTVISLISFIAFTITVTVADLLIGAPYFFNWEWLVLLVLLMPAAALCSVTFVSLIIPRVYSTGEALQTMGYLILPFIVLFLIQFTGIIRINVLFLLVLALLLAILSVVLYNASARRFQPEKLLIRALED